MAVERCAGCGLLVEGGTEGCQKLFEQLVGRDFSDPRYGRMHGMAVDAYCLQHPDRYCVSGKSLAAHLCFMCGQIEFGASRAQHDERMRRWLDGPRQFDKPLIPEFRGAVTIADVLAAAGPEAHEAAVERWAKSAWDAYASLHAIARAWLAEANAAGSTRRKR